MGGINQFERRNQKIQRPIFLVMFSKNKMLSNNIMEDIQELKARIQELEKKLKYVDEYLCIVSTDVVVSGAVLHDPRNPYFARNVSG